MKPMLPVMVEDLIKKATDSSTHPERRQHYVKTLKDIRDAADDAIKKYETDRNFRK
jgi:hypothetical protein